MFDLRAQLLIDAPLDKAQHAEPLLALIEDEPQLSPTHWGAYSELRDPYVRADVLQHVDKTSLGSCVPVLKRLHTPCYSADWFSTKVGISSLSFRPQTDMSKKDAKALVAAIGRLAARMPIEHGFVDIRWSGMDRKLRLDHPGMHTDSYTREGPEYLHARTYFGPRSLAFFGGASAIDKLGGAVTVLDNGAVQLDLVQSPLASDAKKIRAAYDKIKKKLKKKNAWQPPVKRKRKDPKPEWAVDPAAVSYKPQPVIEPPGPAVPYDRLIGAMIDDAKSERLLKKHFGAGKVSKSGGDRYWINRKAGCEISWHGKTKRISTIFLTLTKKPREQPFMGTLPWGLARDDDRKATHNKLGKPARSFDDGDRFVSDRFDVITRFDGDGVLSKVTLSSY